ncbi:MAG TPA: hypothetical protein VK674_04960 [Candidatus Limnocylindria bacterium]|nr:hypothetical protein [Candidatus Limnocylindria bacterium]
MPEPVDYHQLVRRATSNAYVHFDGDSPRANRYDYTQFAALSDSAPIELNRQWLPLPGNLVVDTTDELRQVLRATREILDRADLTDQEIEQIVTHEGQHANAARQVGAEKPLFLASYCRVADPNLCMDETGIPEFLAAAHISPNLRTTKLGLATIMVHPEAHSSADLVHLSRLGYTGGVEQIGELVGTHNDAHPDNPLPMPLSLLAE